MQTIREVMTPDVQTISPQETVQRAAQMMDELNVGAIPVCDGDRLVGLDQRPGDGKLYGVSLSNKVYTVDAMTGAATQVAALSQAIIDPSLGYGIDFNPVADFSGAASLRLVSSAGSNFAINASTGLVGNAASNIGSGYTAVAYSNSMPMPPRMQMKTTSTCCPSASSTP